VRSWGGDVMRRFFCLVFSHPAYVISPGYMMEGLLWGKGREREGTVLANNLPVLSSCLTMHIEGLKKLQLPGIAAMISLSSFVGQTGRVNPVPSSRQPSPVFVPHCCDQGTVRNANNVHHCLSSCCQLPPDHLAHGPAELT